MPSFKVVDLMPEVSEEGATQIAKNCRRRQPHSHLRSPPRVIPANIGMHLIFPETRDPQSLGFIT